MRHAPRRFEDHIGAPAVRWVNEVKWSNDGIEWHDARLVSGSVTRSFADKVHWQASLELAGAGVRAFWDSINPISTRIRIRHGIEFAPGDRELINFGLYQVTEAEDSTDSPTTTVSASSFESFLIASELGRPTRFDAGTSDAMIRQACASVFGGSVSVRWDDRVADKSGTAMPPVMLDTTRWDLIDGDSKTDSVAGALGVRVIADADGGLIVVPVPTLQDAPVGEIRRGRGGLLIRKGRQLTQDGVYNEVIASGSSVDGLSVGPVRVRDTDPNSATYYSRPIIEGGFGPRPFVYTSSLLTSESACTNAARAKLAELIGQRQQVTFDGLHNPLTEPGDVWLVDGDRVILDSVTYDLKGAPLQADTRAQATNSDGSVWDLPDTDDGSGEGDTSDA